MTSVKLYCIGSYRCATVEKENAPFTRRGAFASLGDFADGAKDIAIITLPCERRNIFVECYG
jgi:hypothetical protein